MESRGKDLRTFLKLLDDRWPGEVLRVDTQGKPFDLAECDAAAFLAKLKAGGKRPATLFRGFKTLSGKTWQGELLFSELSTLRKQAAALDLDGEVKFQELAQEFSRRNRLTQKPVKISSAEAPVKQKVVSGAGLSLFDLPVYRKDEFDAKPGWLCAIGVGKEPDSGRYNLSWHRLHVHSPGHASARINPRHLMEYMNRYRAKGADKMPVAFALGHHPIFEVAAGSNCAWGVDEYEFAGGLMDSPVRVTESETLGKDFLIPADAEIVVEGMIDLNKKEFCGPWADVMRYYSPQTLEPVFTPTAFLLRQNPICIGNWTGHDTYGVLGAASYVYSVLKERYPRVLAVNQVCPYTYVIQFKPRVPGESTRLAAMALEKEARKEGELIWYAAMASDRAAELIKGFESKYPFLKVRFQPGGAGRQLEQLLIEHRTKKQRADIINTRRSYVGVMAKAGAVARYRTPLRAALREGFSDKEGFVNGIYAQPRVFLYNTRMVARDKAPQSFEELLEPRWKDKLGMDTTDYDWLASLIDYYGRAKALEYVGKLAKQQLNFRRGPTLLSQLAVAGEFAVVIDAFPEEVLQLRNAKAPIDFIFSEPFVPVKTPTAISIAAGAPHPHAAALFVDFLLSKAGQDIMVAQGRWASRKDAGYLADLKGKKMQIPTAEWDDKQLELIKLYNSLFSLG